MELISNPLYTLHSYYVVLCRETHIKRQQVAVYQNKRKRAVCDRKCDEVYDCQIKYELQGKGCLLHKICAREESEE
jgi:hypothetical protein